jgi:hypothetical protein
MSLVEARELAHYLIGKQKLLDLISPDYENNNQDADGIRKKLSIPLYGMEESRIL